MPTPTTPFVDPKLLSFDLVISGLSLGNTNKTDALSTKQTEMKATGQHHVTPHLNGGWKSVRTSADGDTKLSHVADCGLVVPVVKA